MVAYNISSIRSLMTDSYRSQQRSSTFEEEGGGERERDRQTEEDKVHQSLQNIE